MVPAVTVMAARGTNRCGGAGSGLGCCAMAQSGLGTGRQRHREELVSAVGAPGGGNDGSCWLGRARLLEVGLSEGWGGEEMK